MRMSRERIFHLADLIMKELTATGGVQVKAPDDLRPELIRVLSEESRLEDSIDAEVRKTLLNEFGIEIGAGLGPLAGKIWRIGLMGYSCRPDNVMLCLSALGSVLSDMGLPVHVGNAEAAAHGAYAQMHVKDAQRKKRAA